MVLELIRPNGLLLRRDALRAGYDDNHLARCVRSHQLVRIRQGAYARGSTWRGLDDVGRHLLRCQAVMLQYDDHVALSHGSAAVAWGGPSHGLDLDNVHLTHFEGGGRTTAGVQHHEGTCRVDDVARRDDHWITSPTRTVLDVASHDGLETGVIVGDDFVHRGLTSDAELRRMYAPMSMWPNMLAVRLVLELIDGRAESVGETLIRLLCRNMGLPRPELQWEVRRPDGRLAGRADFAWPDRRAFGEFDGTTKYLRFRRPGETIEQAVLREKRREDLLRELTGWTMIRFVWADIFTPAITAARIRAQLAIAA